MCRNRIIFCLLLLTLVASQRRSASQVATHNLTVPVDEIALTFHASDSRGTPVTNLKLDDLHLSDNGQPPRKILSFQLSPDGPIRVGILLDTSESMTDADSGSRSVADRYAQHVIQQATDQAFVMKFAFQSEIAQPWTNNSADLAVGINRFVSVRSRPGTAIIDSIYRACLNQFGHTTPSETANFILLFSDGEDNVSRGSLKDSVDICQRSNTAIYAIPPRTLSTGINTLADLTAQTGGRILNSGDSDATILADLNTINAERRTQYRLIYRPSVLKHDGSFHHIELTAPDRDATIITRSGYYAPWR
jgi:Ca-activated chloride channel homolog